MFSPLETYSFGLGFRCTGLRFGGTPASLVVSPHCWWPGPTSARSHHVHFGAEFCWSAFDAHKLLCYLDSVFYCVLHTVRIFHHPYDWRGLMRFRSQVVFWSSQRDYRHAILTLPSTSFPHTWRSSNVSAGSLYIWLYVEMAIQGCHCGTWDGHSGAFLLHNAQRYIQSYISLAVFSPAECDMR